MKRYTNEFKVGLFVIFCFLIFFYLIYSTGKLNIRKPGYHIYVTFDEIAGLQAKAPVMLNGVEVGKVEDINIFYDEDRTRIVLKLWLESHAKIRGNPVVSIKTLGLMGEKYIQISSSEGKSFIGPETTLTGKSYLDMDAMMEQIDAISRDLSAQANKLLASLNDTVDGNKEGISNIIKNLEATSKNFEEFSDDIKRHPWKILIKTKEKEKKTKDKEKKEK